MGILAAIVVVALSGCGFIFSRMKRSSAVRSAQIHVSQALPGAPATGNSQELSRAATAAQDASTPSSSSSNKIPALIPARLESLTHELRETAQKDAEICAGVLRGWLKEGQV